MIWLEIGLLALCENRSSERRNGKFPIFKNFFEKKNTEYQLKDFQFKAELERVLVDIIDFFKKVIWLKIGLLARCENRSGERMNGNFPIFKNLKKILNMNWKISNFTQS